ncbi:MAG: MBL fold metallo-hydrolase [Terriglobia bacterium]
MSVRVCVLGSGSKGNSTWVATESTRLLVDAGFSRRETFARLTARGERAETCNAILISHEHSDHVGGLAKLARDIGCPVYITGGTRDAMEWDRKIEACELIEAGRAFMIGDIKVSPFSIPHDAAEPVAFTVEAQGIKIAVVTDLGYIPEHVKQHVRACNCLVFESNHDVEMLKVGPYPWHVKQRVMGRQGHLSNSTTAEFLCGDYDATSQVLVLAHLSETNNHPELARLSALEALERRSASGAPELHLATQTTPTKMFVW